MNNEENIKECLGSFLGYKKKREKVPHSFQHIAVPCKAVQFYCFFLFCCKNILQTVFLYITFFFKDLFHALESVEAILGDTDPEKWDWPGRP